ncbi:17864_t:CDS:2, partial [Racocetra fulgida]
MSPAKTTVFATPSAEGKSSRWYLIAFRNQVEGTSFAWKLLSTTAQEHQMCDRHAQESIWGSGTCLSDLWPLRDHQVPKVTVATMINDDQIAFGYVDSPVVNAEDFDEKPEKYSKIFSWSTNGASHQCNTSSLPSASELEDQAIGASSVQVIVSALMTWGIDNSLDRICLEKLGLKKPSKHVAFDSDANAATVKAMAQKAIFQISTVNTPLCISTLTLNTNNSKKPAEKNGFLKLISLFIRKKPLVLYTSLSSLVEAVVKSLDPNIPKMRDTVLQTTTNVLHDLVKTFPSISFHGGTQKLAGHTKSVSAVTFSGDGKFIVSCSLEEGTVRVWNPSPGLLGMLAGSFAGGNMGNNSKTE